jgi:L-ascorbate metabolism protein UlaG (beta-lactamase superfamily)
MTTRIRYLGIAAYEIVSERHRILMDPFLTGSPVAPVGPDDLERPDVILVSHSPTDHLGDTAAIALRTGAPVVCGQDSTAVLMERGVPESQIRTTIWGIQVEVGGVHVWPVECHHWAMARLADGSTVTGSPLGFIVEPEPGVRVYHFGDSAVFGDMRLIGQLYRPTVGILGCTQPKPLLPLFNAGAGTVLTGEMSPDEAALAAELLGVRYAIGTHYVDVDDEDVTAFLAAVPAADTSGARMAMALTAGQTLVLDGDTHRIEEPGVA